MSGFLASQSGSPRVTQSDIAAIKKLARHLFAGTVTLLEQPIEDSLAAISSDTPFVELEQIAQLDCWTLKASFFGKNWHPLRDKYPLILFLGQNPSALVYHCYISEPPVTTVEILSLIRKNDS